MVQANQQSYWSCALEGVRIVELSQFDAGATCAEILAWLGADVVKVELPSGVSRRYSDTEQRGVDSHEFIFLNANKRSVTCDFESERGKQDLAKLLAKADVVIEHLVPGSIERLGFGYDTVRKLNSRIIYAQIQGFASDGPRANYQSSDRVAQAVGGVISGTGYVGGPPLISGAAIADTGAALHCAMGVLAALYQRQMTGRGQKVEVSMQGAVINLNRTAYVPLLTRGKPQARLGNTSRLGSVPNNLFPCKPGGPNDHVFINISNSANNHWLGLLKALGREDLAGDVQFATPKARGERRAEVEAMVTAWTESRTKIDAMTAVQNAGAPAGAVLDTKDLSVDPNLRRRGVFVTIEHPVRGAVTMPGWPVKMSESHVPVRAAPLLGEHTEAVWSDWFAPHRQDSGNAESKVGGSLARELLLEGALAGVRVVDLTQLEAGTSCTESLAWLGADVVKIEEPQRGERGRYSNTEKPGTDAIYFIVLNANKRSLTCNIKSESGKELLKRLIAKADVVVENMAPGAIERLGFGYDVVRELNPRIIYAQIKGFAADGPQANYVCFDMIAQSVGGSLSVNGLEGQPPLKAGANLGDTGAGMHCAVGILAALCQRQRTGHGQRIQVAMQEAVINFCRLAFTSYLSSGKAQGRHGERDLYRCKGDGSSDYCFIDTAQAGDGQLHRLLSAIGRQDLIANSTAANFGEFVKLSEEIKTLLSAWCSERTKSEVMDILQRAGISAGAVFDTKELIEDTELRKCGIFAGVEHPQRGAMTMPGWPVRMSDSHVAVRSAPLLGMHTEAVLSEWLGLTPQEIAEIRKKAPVAN